MKRILVILFCLISVSVNAQKLPETSYRVRLSEADKTILAEINPVNAVIKAKAALYYYWYSAGVIHATQGGFSGKLLNGVYTEYYLNKNLKEQGTFKRGLKSDIWKTWNDDGSLKQTATWKDGVMVTGTPPSFWKKLNILKKRNRQPVADTLAKPMSKV
ncbi:MAG: hypothetical protein JWP37_4425 [Mucilaginibacter sp.]|nr:hypothetical protein [Mucilaginibacter sp.]